VRSHAPRVAIASRVSARNDGCVLCEWANGRVCVFACEAHSCDLPPLHGMSRHGSSSAAAAAALPFRIDPDILRQLVPVTVGGSTDVLCIAGVVALTVPACSVCLERYTGSGNLMPSNGFECGHSVCSGCMPSLHRCPICRAPQHLVPTLNALAQRMLVMFPFHTTCPMCTAPIALDDRGPDRHAVACKRFVCAVNNESMTTDAMRTHAQQCASCHMAVVVQPLLAAFTRTALLV
jgi:hypothetical protein